MRRSPIPWLVSLSIYAIYIYGHIYAIYMAPDIVYGIYGIYGARYSGLYRAQVFVGGLDAVYALGGRDGDSFHDSVEVFNVTSRLWVRTQPHTSP